MSSTWSISSKCVYISFNWALSASRSRSLDFSAGFTAPDPDSTYVICSLSHLQTMTSCLSVTQDIFKLMLIFQPVPFCAFACNVGLFSVVGMKKLLPTSPTLRKIVLIFLSLKCIYVHCCTFIIVVGWLGDAPTTIAELGITWFGTGILQPPGPEQGQPWGNRDVLRPVCSQVLNILQGRNFYFSVWPSPFCRIFSLHLTGTFLAAVCVYCL